MLKVVIDASIALKWLNRASETEVVSARNLYRRLLAGTIEIWSPNFLLIEVLNILVMKKKIERKKALRLIKRLTQRNIHFATFTETDITGLGRVMFDHHISSYDALYLHLTKKLKCKLVTADQKLLEIKRWTIGLGSFAERV
mgnify:CR=1 FL=1